MKTVRDIISQLRESLRNVNVDTRFSNQFLHSLLLTTAQLIIKREAETRKIYRSLEVFSRIKCFNLEQLDESNCAGIMIPTCNFVMKSVDKLPKAFQSSTGSIINVFSIDQRVKFDQTIPSTYESISKREYKTPNKYFWIADDYLYIPDLPIKAVTIFGVFADNYGVDKLNDPDSCHKFMDSLCGIPEWLEEDIITVCIQKIGGVTLRIPEDSNPNLNPNN